MHPFSHWQVVKWSNVSSPTEYLTSHTMDTMENTPPLQNWTLGTVQELWFAGWTEDSEMGGVEYRQSAKGGLAKGGFRYLIPFDTIR
eukprot:9973661-Heterocapsa_arctica.AAC.1